MRSTKHPDDDDRMVVEWEEAAELALVLDVIAKRGYVHAVTLREAV